MSDVQADATYRVGVDIGGTFTDLILVETTSGAITVGKSLTTPTDPSEAVETVLRDALARAGVAAARVEHVIHGTTLATGAVLNTLAFLSSNLRAIFTFLVARLLGGPALGTFGVAWAVADGSVRPGPLVDPHRRMHPAVRVDDPIAPFRLLQVHRADPGRIDCRFCRQHDGYEQTGGDNHRGQR